MDSGTPSGPGARLESLRRRRAELRDSMNALERRLAAPVTEASQDWVRRAHGCLVALADDFAVHVEITEGPGGLYAELRESAPRLSGAVSRLTEEHSEIAKLLDEALTLSGPDVVADAAAVRDLGTAVLGRLVRHRQRGSDLVYEAYEVDIGGDT